MLQIADTNVVTTISSLIQLSVAPVFLLAGVAGLLNVFIGRLARIIDKVEKIDSYIDKKEKLSKQKEEKTRSRRFFLIIRMQNTNLAIFFCTATGLMIALVILLMFLSVMLEFNSATMISILFILAMSSLIISLLLFLREIYFTTSFIQKKKNNLKAQDKE